MTGPPDSQITLNRALRRVHRSVLLTLAVGAVVAFLSAKPGDGTLSAGAERSFTVAAVACAVASILTRRRRVAGGPVRIRSHVTLGLASLLFAGGVGLVGVALALAGGARATALVYLLAGAIFALRPPAPVAVRPSEERP